MHGLSQFGADDFQCLGSELIVGGFQVQLKSLVITRKFLSINCKNRFLCFVLILYSCIRVRYFTPMVPPVRKAHNRNINKQRTDGLDRDTNRVWVCLYCGTYLRIYIHTYVCMYIYYIHTYIHTHIHIYIHTCTHTHNYRYTQSQVHTHIHTYIHTLTKYLFH